MGSQRFRAVIAAGPRDSAVITMPFDPDEAWGAKADHPVSGTIGGCRIRTRLVPAGSGWVLTLAPKRLLSMGIAIGDDVTVELAPEGPQRSDIATALAANAAAGAFFLRLGAALALTGIAIGALQLGVTGASLPGGVLVLARNVIGITGIGLLASLVTGGLLAWIPPPAYLGFAEYALNEAWRNPWTWPVRPPADRGAWICAVLVFAVGLAAATFRGARTSLADNG